MSLQKKTLQRYRQLFPCDTLREISARTGVQITRVFRLYNGKTMKVKELEAFENAINERISQIPSYSHLSTVLEDAALVLTTDEFSKIVEYVHRRVKARSYVRLYSHSNYEQAINA